MKPLLRLLLALALGLPAAASPTPHAADEAALREIKEVLWPRAYREQDTALLDRILAPEFRMIDDSGGWSAKGDELAYIAKHRPTYDSFRFEIKRLDIFENGTAIVAGTGHIETRKPAGIERVIYQSTNVLLKRDGRWQAVASHVSGVRPATP